MWPIRSVLAGPDYLKALKKLTRASEEQSLNVLVDVFSAELANLKFGASQKAAITAKLLTKKIYRERCRLVHSKSSRIEEIGFAERYVGELVEWDLLKFVEWLAIKSIEKWGIKS